MLKGNLSLFAYAVSHVDINGIIMKLGNIVVGGTFSALSFSGNETCNFMNLDIVISSLSVSCLNFSVLGHSFASVIISNVVLKF